MKLPNILTIFRLILIPVFVLFFFATIQNGLIYSIIIFLVAGLTDILDGYIARKYNLITTQGIVLDPLADKLMLLTVLGCLVIKFYIPAWVLFVIAAKELFMIFSAIFLYKKGTVIPSNIFGKTASVLFYFSILTLVFSETYGIYLLYISVFSAIIALINYSIFYFTKKKVDPSTEDKTL